MLVIHNSRCCLDLILIFCYAFVCIAIGFGNFNQVQALPAASVDFFSPPANKIESKSDNDDSAVEQSFHQFINSKPESTIIGELKPNASALELMLLRNKISNTIQRMQEMEKQAPTSASQPNSVSAECFIEVTRVSII